MQRSCRPGLAHTSPPHNVGDDKAYTDQRGRVYLPDQEWTEETQAGYIGGYTVYGRFPVGGTPDRLMYENQRRDWQEYRFSGIPNGDYLVTLHFAEIAVLDEHGPSYTVFSVAIEDETVLDELNNFAEVGGNYALVRRFAVTVTDGELNVTSTPVFGESRLAAIEVAERSREPVAPAIPADLTAIGSYNAVLLDWADNPDDDLGGYHIYRADSPAGTTTRLTTEPIYVSRYQDVVTTPTSPTTIVSARSMWMATKANFRLTDPLLTRVLNVPQFRAYYCHRLAEFMNTIFSDAAMYSLLSARVPAAASADQRVYGGQWDGAGGPR